MHSTFPNFLVTTRFSGKNTQTQNVFCFALQHLSETFLILRRIQRDIIILLLSYMCIVVHVQYPIFLSGFNETCFFSSIFEKYSNVSFRKRKSSGSGVVPRGRMGGRTDMTKLIVAFLSFVKVPDNES